MKPLDIRSLIQKKLHGPVTEGPHIFAIEGDG